MTEQNLKTTHAIYDRFDLLAKFVREQATKDEALALHEALSNLNNAIRQKLGLKEGDIVQISYGTKDT